MIKIQGPFRHMNRTYFWPVIACLLMKILEKVKHAIKIVEAVSIKCLEKFPNRSYFHETAQLSLTFQLRITIKHYNVERPLLIPPPWARKDWLVMVGEGGALVWHRWGTLWGYKLFLEVSCALPTPELNRWVDAPMQLPHSFIRVIFSILFTFSCLFYSPIVQ